MFRWFGKRRRTSGNSDPTGADIAAEFSTRFGTEEREERLPAWALMLRSPYETSRPVSSWLGGAPSAPNDFEWPNDSDRTPLHFLAQIDLASLKPEPETGARPPGLPEIGALLVFVGRSCACRILDARDMSRAAPLPLPDRLEPVSKHGFFSKERTFTYWPVDPVGYLDTLRDSRDGRPEFLPDTFTQPADWITTCGIAALDAEIAIESLTVELRQGEQFEKTREQLGSKLPDNAVTRSKTRHYTLMKRKAPELIAALSAWRELTLSKSPADDVNRVQFAEIMRMRLDLSDEMESYPPKSVLAGNAARVWEKIWSAYPQLRRDRDYTVLPAAYRPFVEARITDWRRHRLFGIEPPFPNNGEDLRGRDCLISIAADPLLGTESEHEYGMSVWCPREDMANGRYDRGQFIRHCAV